MDFYKKFTRFSSAVIWWAFGCFLLLPAGVFMGNSCSVEAKTDGYPALKKALETPGNAVIELHDTVSARGTIYVRGKKRIVGNGFSIRRGDSSGKTFGGTLFCVAGGNLTLQGTVVSGSGRNPIYGRLVEVQNGKFVLERNSVLRNNCNTVRSEEGGGAVIVRKGGIFVMKAGVISRNRTVTEGAAVYVETGGRFEMRGGIIEKNIVRGIGVVEGFDGRGGAIFNNGTVLISGGILRCNYAFGFRRGNMQYGGAGGLMFNRGSCVITGGTIEKNISSDGGGAIYNDTHSSLRILGGTFRGNQKKRKSRPEANTKPEGKKKKPEGRESALWEKGRVERAYYVGEKLNERVLKYGIRVRVDGRRIPQNRIRVVRVTGVLAACFKTSTDFLADRTGSGEIYAAIRGKESSYGEYAVPYRVIKNKQPHIFTAPRYLFTWEVTRYSKIKWREVLREGVKLQDCEDDVRDLWEKAVIQPDGLFSGRDGIHRVKVRVWDQWGHRFYMKKGEKRRYGAGCKCTVEIAVTLVKEANIGKEEAYGTVRFLPEYGSADDSVCMEWHFSPELLKEVHAFIKSSRDPFSELANDAFLKRFGGAKKQWESGG